MWVDPEGEKLVLSRKNKEDGKWTNNFEAVKLDATAMSLGRVGNTDSRLAISQALDPVGPSCSPQRGQ